MCYAIPAKTIKITKDTATVDYGGVVKETNLSLIDNVSVGDYVLIHAGFAIEKMDTKTAEDALEIIKKQIELSEEK